MELVNNVGTGASEGYDPTGWVESDTSSTEAHLTGNYKPDDGKITKVALWQSLAQRRILYLSLKLGHSVFHL